jgi:hypothetical protein
MTLAERIKKKTVLERQVEVEGEAFLVRGLSRLDRSRQFAASTKAKSGTLDIAKLEANLLAVCVLDPETRQPVFATAAEWDSVASHITAPLVEAVKKVCGLDNEDLPSPNA